MFNAITTTNPQVTRATGKKPMFVFATMSGTVGVQVMLNS